MRTEVCVRRAILLVVATAVLAACSGEKTPNGVAGSLAPTDGTSIEEPDDKLPTSVAVVYPDDAGVLDVRRDFGAVGDGTTDDTAAMQAAISAGAELEGTARGRIVYLPEGEYLVSDTLEWRTVDGQWGCCITLQGAGRTLTTIRLADDAARFDEPDAIRPVIATASFRSDEPDGAGNEAFRNSILDLTIDVGQLNPSATGIDWLSNNVGAIQRVSVISSDSDRAGHAGISMLRRWPGPGLITDVDVVGFDYGIDIGSWQYSITLEHVRLREQRIGGIRNDRNVLVARDLQSDNLRPAVICGTADAVVMLVDSDLQGGLPSERAVAGTCSLFLQDVRSDGYLGIAEGTSDVVAEAIAVSSDGTQVAMGPALIERDEPPAVEWPDAEDWANVKDFGANPDDWLPDDAAIAAAFASGRSAIYFPPGSRSYVVSVTAVVPPNVTRLAGMESSIGESPDASDVIFEMAAGGGAPLVIQNIAFNVDDGPMKIVTSGDRPLVVEHALLGVVEVRGDAFVDDSVAALSIAQDARVWARQLNTEFGAFEGAANVNNGGDLWVLGLKTEKAVTVVRTSGGGRTEVIGGFHYPTTGVGPERPAYRVDGGVERLAVVTHADSPDSDYEVLVSMEECAPVFTQFPRGSTVGAFVVQVPPSPTDENC